MHHCPRAEPRAGNGAGTHPAARRGMPMRIYRARGRRPRPRAPRTAAAWRSPSGSLPVSQFFASGGGSIGASASASALPELQVGPLLSSVQKTQSAGEQLCAQETGSWTVSLKQDQVLTSSLRQAG
ncbi:unnamed protein product [Rangifer tarandus platyrhynchus]|uniref:Uncharacterized protein n=1 Tax=Rangifer tarandus platyrhynchus TaxID=3082113 RepID=A0AC59Z6F2_RANTA